jgi:monoamine oxidase
MGGARDAPGKSPQPFEAHQVAAKALDHVASFPPLPGWRVGGGNQQLPNALAARLGSAVHLAVKVRSISQDQRGVAVTANGTTALFDAAVVALPLAIVRDRAALTLAMPAWKRAVLGHVLQGHAASCTCHCARRRPPAP